MTPSAPPILAAVELAPYHTFGLRARADALVVINHIEQLEAASQAYGAKPALILGGGSNILPLARVPGLVALNGIGGISIERTNAQNTWVRVGSGVGWHDLVQWCLSQGLGGIENLALIPGTAGAAPMQNIGAYGVELQDVFESLEAWDLQAGQVHTFDRAACQFGYRDSFFKQAGRGRFFITSLLLRLHRQPRLVNTSYGAIQDTLRARHITQPTIQDVAQAVIDIRSSKLPDWRVLGNAGSFFKNPVVPAALAHDIQREHPQAPSYPQPDGSTKLAAGWLIDQCGWRGQRSGAVGCYPHQALVLVNYGGATGREVLDFSERIAASVQARFGVALEREVNVVGVDE